MIEQIIDILESKQYSDIKPLLEGRHPGDISDIIEELPNHYGGIVFRLLPKDLAIEVFENFDSSFRETLLASLKSEEVIKILNEMSPDDRTRLFEELPASVVRKYLALLNDEERKIANMLLGYQDYSAGRIMTTDFLELHEDFTVKRALEAIRSAAPTKETIYYCYVMSRDRKLTGVVSLRTILLSDPEDKVGDLMTAPVISVTTDTPQEEVAATMAEYDFLAIPVVDLEGRLVGIITHDDIIDVITQEDTEDIHLMGGVTTTDKNLMDLTIWDNIKRRAGWLLVMLVFQSFSTSILESYESALSVAVALSFFIPLLIGTGGNSGTQSSTVVIRAIATGELEPKDYWRAIGRELVAASILGGILGVLVSFRAYVSTGSILIGLTVGISLAVVIAIASVAGTVLPMLADRLKIDPAVMAGPLITTVVDIVGLITYLEVAKYILKI
ncbi:MAG TPA: magnesium transporter [Bacillota bacterium]|jgi:magnesium transporter|nr:magnesium transporter [Bacillota bacterium]NLU54759.1 magnesium transporter [Bacillota bacterium]HOJ46360.1 magnesium transporter [Bacillota bacterium]HOL13104.1 magnesium transporter [Bacillota bacterium]HPQ10945.1 magnesium transporter [Bacillota bacterium]